MWDLSLNAHYLFRLSDKFVLYPLAGVGILGVKSSVSMDLGEFDGDISASASEFGFNLGAGFDFKLSEKLALNVQAKYMFAGDWGRFVPTAGIIYKF
jgi:outer membrane protein X